MPISEAALELLVGLVGGVSSVLDFANPVERSVSGVVVPGWSAKIGFEALHIPQVLDSDWVLYNDGKPARSRSPVARGLWMAAYYLDKDECEGVLLADRRQLVEHNFRPQSRHQTGVAGTRPRDRQAV